MVNQKFSLLSEKERKAKFKAVLNTKAKGGLTGEEIQELLQILPANQQYEIIIYHGLDDFCGNICQAEGRKRLVLGTAYVETGNKTGKFVCDVQSETIAITIQKQTESEKWNQLHIFIPTERYRKEAKAYE